MSHAALRDLLRSHAVAAVTLRRAFRGKGEALWGNESPDQLSFVTDVSAEWLAARLEGLANVLAAASYRIQLSVRIDDWQTTVDVSRARGNERGPHGAEPLEMAGLLVPFERLAALAEVGARPDLDILVRAIADVADAAAEETAAARRARSVDVRLSIGLDKAAVADEIEKLDGGALRPGFWVFPESLQRTLAIGGLATLDRWLTPGRRHTIVVAGLRGALEGDGLSVFGARPAHRSPDDHLEALRVALVRAIHPSLAKSIEAALEFRDDNCVWLPGTLGLTPESVRMGRDDASPALTGLLADAFDQLRALLALAFIANRCLFRSPSSDVMELTVKGQASRAIAVGAGDVAGAAAADIAAVHKLYSFAYDGRSVDKLEIVRQMMALLVTSPSALFEKADDVRQAAESAHGTYLKGQVAEYFAVRRAVQEHLQNVVTETEAAAIELTRDAAERVFKAAGIVAGAVVAAALNADLENLAGLLAAAAITFYAGMTVRYYARPLKWSAVALRNQARAHIEAFRDILGDDMTVKLVADEHMAAAWKRYADERELAVALFSIVLTGAVLVAVVFGFRLG